MQCNIILIIIAVATSAIALWQLIENRRGVKLAELKATLPPDIISISSTGDGYGGLKVSWTIVGRSEIPIILQKITLNTWNRNNPENNYPPIEETLSVELAKDKELRGKLHCPINKFKTDEIKNVELLMKDNFFTTVTGELCLYYKDFNGNLQKKCKKFNRLR